MEFNCMNLETLSTAACLLDHSSNPKKLKHGPLEDETEDLISVMDTSTMDSLIKGAVYLQELRARLDIEQARKLSEDMKSHAKHLKDFGETLDGFMTEEVDVDKIYDKMRLEMLEESSHTDPAPSPATVPSPATAPLHPDPTPLCSTSTLLHPAPAHLHPIQPPIDSCADAMDDSMEE